MDTTDPRPIALVGIMGSGKSAVARALGARLGRNVVDLDQRLEDEEGMSVSELFATRGEAEFRRVEALLLARAVAEPGVVLDLGGGAVLDAGSRALLRDRCHTVWLEVSPITAAARVARDGDTRPLLAGAPAATRLEALLGERATLYAEVARHRVDTNDRTVEQVSRAVEEALACESR